MSAQTLTKKTGYFIRGVDLARAAPDNPEFEASRREVSLLLEQVRMALANRSASAPMLEESRVPPPPIEMPRACVNCSYTKIVNYQEVEHWDNGARGCGDCGMYIEGTTRIVDYHTVENITECWEFQVISSPQP